MSVGELVSALSLYCQEDCLLFIKSIDEIGIRGDRIHLYFTDGNTRNVAINKEGVEVPWE